jgi:hypothetical protein
VQVIKSFWQRKNEVGAGDGILGVSTWNGIPCERGRVAEILETTLTIGTGTVGSAEPRNADPCAESDLFRRAADNFADNLVAGNHSWLLRRKFSFDDVQVSAANAARTHSQQDVPSRGFWIGEFGNFQRTLRNWLWRSEDGGFHERSTLMQ